MVDPTIGGSISGTFATRVGRQFLQSLSATVHRPAFDFPNPVTVSDHPFTPHVGSRSGIARLAHCVEDQAVIKISE